MFTKDGEILTIIINYYIITIFILLFCFNNSIFFSNIIIKIYSIRIFSFMQVYVKVGKWRRGEGMVRRMARALREVG